MGYVKQGNKMLLWGRVTREPKLSTTKTGKKVCGFSMQYDRHHNEDGQIVNEFIEVSCWNNLALYVGDNDIGLARNDIVIVCGELIQDNFYGKNEDKSKPKYKVNADLVLDTTSIFQLMQMVVTPEEEEAEEPKPVKPDLPKKVSSNGLIDIDDEEDPFSADEDDDDDIGELPY